MPVVAVENEVSLQVYEQQTKDGTHRRPSLRIHSREKPDGFDSVIATCKELSIAVIAYSYVLHSSFLPLTHPRQSAWSRTTHRSYQEPAGPGRR